MSLDQITKVDPWPERKLPKERFDEKVQLAMAQMAIMVEQLNNRVIPVLNEVQVDSIPDLKTASDTIKNTVDQLSPKVTQIETALNDKASTSVATASANGLMSSGDKSKLDSYPSKNNSTTQYLRGDGTWQTPPNDNTIYSAATQSVSGLMSASDKAKLDGIAAGAQVNVTQTDVSGNAGTATKLATARSIQTNLGSTSGANFDGTGNITPGITGTLGLGNGGTGSTSASGALSNLGGILKSGDRGQLAGSETAQALSGSQTISANSADCINLTTSGAVTLTFQAAADTVRSVKAICLKASAATTLTVSGAVWANKGSAPTWGNAGTILVLLAHFVGARVVLTVTDNTQ